MTDTNRNPEAILWSRLDIPGHEVAELTTIDSGFNLAGVAVLAHEGKPCRLEYDIRCDEKWMTHTATLGGYAGDVRIDIEILRNEAAEWSMNGSKVWEVTGCDDVDLNFSPVTNMLPIRRLNLDVGESARVRAAWVRFPSFRLELLEQTYTRQSSGVYVYESANGKFRRELTVDSAGFVLDYPDFWQSEARNPA